MSFSLESFVMDNKDFCGFTLQFSNTLKKPLSRQRIIMIHLSLAAVCTGASADFLLPRNKGVEA